MAITAAGPAGARPPQSYGAGVGSNAWAIVKIAATVPGSVHIPMHRMPFSCMATEYPCWADARVSAATFTKHSSDTSIC